MSRVGIEPVTARGARGLTAVVLRRMCLGITLLAGVVTIAYHPGVEQILLALAVLLAYIGVLSMAIRSVYGRSRVGRAETAAMLTTTVSFALAVLLVPRRVGTGYLTGGTSFVPADSQFGQPIPGVEQTEFPLYNSPVLQAFGHHTASHTQPWTLIALLLALVAVVGVLTQWVLVARLRRSPEPRRDESSE